MKRRDGRSVEDGHRHDKNTFDYQHRHVICLLNHANDKNNVITKYITAKREQLSLIL